MIQLVLKLLNMSISASWLVLAVILLRLLFRKAPKWINCLLWSIVGLRLIMPFSFESELSLIPSAEVIPQDIVTSQTPAIYSGISAVNSTVNPLFTQYLTPEGHVLEKILWIASVVWLAGVMVLLLYSAVSYWRLRRRVQASIQMQNNLYVCDDVESPFILGSLFPRIYIPSGMDSGYVQYVLAHETAHLKRLDHWWKPLGFLLLTIYWFNPLLWLAYIMLCRDIECACDEKVITKMDNAGKRAYSEALVACSVHRRLVMACPVAFGEVGVKTRIKGILCYRKPAFWIILAATVVCSVTAVCFLTNPIPCIHRYTANITTQSTCTQKGVQTFTCKACGHSYTAPAQLLAHNYVQRNVLIEPDCTHQGSMELACTGCGTVKTVTLEKTAHTLGAPFLSQAPNCAETGTMSAQCTLCHSVHVVGTVETNEDHDLLETVIVEASCATAGKGVFTCSRCDYREYCTYEKHEHRYMEDYVRPGNCMNTGLMVLTCADCDNERHVILPESGEHSWNSSSNGPTRCFFCGTIKPGTGEEWGYGANNLFSTQTTPATNSPQFPVIQWDVRPNVLPEFPDTSPLRP